MEGVLALIQRERHGEAVDRQLLSSLLRMLNNLALYQSAFERLFLEETASFYMVEGERYMQETDVPQYLIHCEVSLLGRQ